TFKFRTIEDVKPPVEKKPTLRTFILAVCLGAVVTAIFLHVLSQQFLQKQALKVRQLQEKIDQSQDKMQSRDIFIRIKNLSLKQIFLQKVLMHVINDFSDLIFLQRIFMQEGKI